MPADLWAFRERAARAVAKADRGCARGDAIAILASLMPSLLDQGRPATVILDDALVFSDDDRIERMFDIMTRAAERMQIVVLTCRKRLFTRLGASMLRIEAGDAPTSFFA